MKIKLDLYFNIKNVERFSSFLTLPLQTSPNCPAPKRFDSSRDSRSISHASLLRAMTGFDFPQGFSNFCPNPSADSV